MPKRGLLIAIEGIDGSGKSSLALALKGHLEGRGLPVVLTKEPTDGEWGRRIKSLPLVGEERMEKGEEPSSLFSLHPSPPLEELRLFVEDRKEHVRQVIRPALEAGKVVITDRYYLSTIAYQGALGIDTEEIRRVNEEFAPRPDLVLLLTLSPEMGMARIKENRRLDRFERERYLKRVDEIYSALAESEPYIRRLDAGRPFDEVVERALYCIDELFKRSSSP